MAVLAAAVVLAWLQLGLTCRGRLEYLERVDRIGNQRPRPEALDARPRGGDGATPAGGNRAAAAGGDRVDRAAGGDRVDRAAAGELPPLLPSPFEDGHVWVAQVRQMARRGQWRLPWTLFDNAPRGRPVYWSSLYHWWLLGLGWLRQGMNGGDLARSIEHAALVANPLLLALLLPLGGWVAARAGGGGAATIVVLALTGAYPIRESFLTGHVDHHGLIVGCGLGTILCLLAAAGVRASGGTDPERAGRPPPAGTAGGRGWVLASAACGAVGLWVSAFSEAVLLAGVGLGALLALIERSSGPEPRPRLALDPHWWREWGRAGALLSLGFYLVEAFPGRLGMRLEVNHPLYALAWWGGAELLAQLWLARRARDQSAGPGPGGLRRTAGRFRQQAGARTVLAALALAALPAAVLLGGPAWYVLRDPFLWRLHQHIEEFRPLTTLAVGYDWQAILRALSPLPCYLPLAVLLLAGRRRWLRPADRDVLALTLGPALLLGIAALGQLRWTGIWLSALAVLGVTASACAWRALRNGQPRRAPHQRAAGAPGRPPRRALGGRAVRALGVLALLAPPLGLLLGSAATLTQARTQARGHTVGAADMLSLLVRDASVALAETIDGEPAVVLASPYVTVRLAYFAGLHGVGSLYWENLAGLRKSAEIFASTDVAETRALLARYGVTHIVLFSEHAFLGTYYLLARGTLDAPAVRSTLMARLLEGEAPPAWLRPIPYRLPRARVDGRRLRMRLFEVVDRPDGRPAPPGTRRQ